MSVKERNALETEMLKKLERTTLNECWNICNEWMLHAARLFSVNDEHYVEEQP